MAGRDPPPFLNTEEDRGAIVAVISFTFVTVSTLTNGIRVCIRQRSESALGLDDALLVAANAIAVVQTILVGASVKHGLGRHFDTLSDGSIAQYHKFSYTSSILAILAMALAKFSVLQLQRRLCGIQSTSRYIKVMYWALAGTIVFWTLLSVFALAFQCGVKSPYTYEPERCANGMMFYPVTVINAVTDAALAVSFNPVLLKLVAKTRMKVKVMVLLGTRMLVCIATIIQIAYLAQGLTESDQTRGMIKPVVLQQIVMNLSILTAVVLSLHAFISNLTAGAGFGVEVRGSANELSYGSQDRSRNHTNVTKASARAHRGSYNQSSHDHRLRAREGGSSLRPDNLNKSNAWAQHEEANEWERSSRRSDGSQDNIIKQTVTWQVSTSAAGSRGDEEVQTPHPDGELREARARNF